MYEYAKKNKEPDYSEKRDKSTGIPIDMKRYIENQTGLSYDDVRIHYNSNKPRQFEALGYTQGNNIFLEQGQEKHLMHELLHVAQQKKRLVKPTSFTEKYAVNDDVKMEREAGLCEEQYKRNAPVQMLRNAASQHSHAMDKDGLAEESQKYHTLGYFKLEGFKGGSVWSNKEPYMDKGDGDHAEDAVCDIIETILLENYLREQRNEKYFYKLEGKKLTIWLSSSPCMRCNDRLNELTEYGLIVNVIAAKEYCGDKCGGASDSSSRKYNLTIVPKEQKDNLLQFKK